MISKIAKYSVYFVFAFALTFCLACLNSSRRLNKNEVPAEKSIAHVDLFPHEGEEEYYLQNTLPNAGQVCDLILPGWYLDSGISTRSFFPGVSISYDMDLANWQQIVQVLGRPLQLYLQQFFLALRAHQHWDVCNEEVLLNDVLSFCLADNSRCFFLQVDGV